VYHDTKIIWNLFKVLSHPTKETDGSDFHSSSNTGIALFFEDGAG
jgi:hypothetical protein